MSAVVIASGQWGDTRSGKTVTDLGSRIDRLADQLTAAGRLVDQS
jgi:hypothetical protein